MKVQERQWLIYALKDPRTNEVRYVGRTARRSKRLVEHLWESSRAFTDKQKWIRQLRMDGVRPTLEVLECGVDDGDQKAERRWIAALLEQGSPLVNSRRGGGGGVRQHTAETRAKMSKAHKGRTFSDEQNRRLRISLAHKGRKLSDEHKAKLILSNTGKRRQGKPWSAETRLKHGQPWSAETRLKHALRPRKSPKGRVLSAETRAKISLSKTPELRARVSRALTGRTLSAETRAKISAAEKGRPRKNA